MQTDQAETSAEQPVGQLSNLPPGLHIGKLSDIGRERERNEDSFIVLQSLLHHELGAELFGLCIVADGMGGHQKGDLASVLAVRVVAKNIFEDAYLPYLTNDQSANNRPINEALQLAVAQANNAVLNEVPDGGTTMVLALLLGNNAYIANVGDSRAYYFKAGTLKKITEDHSLAQRLENLGQSSEETMQVQNVLYRAIGQGEPIEVDTHMQHLVPGSSLLLCSDGLWGLVDDERIKTVLENANTPQEVCDKLVALANEAGGRDNITVIVATKGVES